MILSRKGTVPQDGFLIGLNLTELFCLGYPNLATHIFINYLTLINTNLSSKTRAVASGMHRCDLYFVELNSLSHF